MMKQAQTMTILLLFLSLPTWACSFAQTTESFEIDAAGFIAPQATEFEVADIIRGSDDGNQSSCSDVGSITLRAIDLPPDTGYIFEIVKGEFADAIFTDGPVTPTQFKKPNEFEFIWLDGASYEQEPIDIVVQVTPVSRSGMLGEPTNLHISHAGVRKSWWQFW